MKRDIKKLYALVAEREKAHAAAQKLLVEAMEELIDAKEEEKRELQDEEIMYEDYQIPYGNMKDDCGDHETCEQCVCKCNKCKHEKQCNGIYAVYERCICKKDCCNCVDVYQGA
jgi:hypothetical protein